MLPLTFDGEKCPDGVEIKDFGPAGEPVSVLGGWSGNEGLHLKPRTTRRVAKRFELKNFEFPISLKYANARTWEAIEAFHAENSAMAVGGFSDQSKIQKWHDDFAKSVRKAFGTPAGERSAIVNDLLKEVRLTASFDITDSKGKGNMVIHPHDLGQFMCSEIAMALTENVDLRACKSCDSLFFVGPLAYRRSDAETCSTSCRMAYMRSKRVSAKVE